MSEIGGTLERPSRSRRHAATGLLGVLEERVASLVERQREARKTVHELQTRLRDREAKIGELTGLLADRERLRRDLRRRVHKLIERVAQLEKATGADGGRGGTSGARKGERR